MLDSLNIEQASRRRLALERPPRLDLAASILGAIRGGQSSGLVGRLLTAMRGPGHLTPQEFFYYRLHDPEVPTASLPRFAGKMVQHRMHFACNKVEWFAACHDKLLWSTIIGGAGLPGPTTVAVFSKQARFGAAPALRDEADLRRFLQEPANLPLFCKPIDGMFSIGAIRIESLDGETVTINGGETRRLDELIQFIVGYGSDGYLFQTILVPDQFFGRLTGSALPSVRFLTLLEADGARIESAVIKLPRWNQVADNYWRDGNAIGAISLETGTITRIVTGTGMDLKVVGGADAVGVLLGAAIPGFEAVMGVCLDAARNFPGIRTQSWDVALTDNGPVLLELNFGGDVNLHQLAHNRGILSDRYCRHLRACGYKKALPQEGS